MEDIKEVKDVKVKKRRAMTTRNVYDKKPGKPVVCNDAAILRTLGDNASCGGMWLISGKEKNGKTSFALMLAKSLASNHKVVYVSAEEETDDSFVAAMRRAGITVSDRIKWEEYLPFESIIEQYSKVRTADFIFIDNLTAYTDEVRRADILKVKKSFPAGKTLVFVAHEEGNRPDPESALAVSKFAKIKFRVVSMNVMVTSRYANGGGNIVIDEDRKALFFGEVSR